MYRESLLGVALAATLEEISEKHPLTREQKEHLWRIFDETMDSCLSEVPVMSRICVKMPSGRASAAPVAGEQQGPEGRSSEEGPAECPQEGAPPTTSQAACESSSRVGEEEDATVFPVYRMIDGLWTILLKDPIVQVRDEFGTETEVQLDYLKVYLKDPQRQRRTRRKRE
ncbi:unnamed protein product [Phytomonas sp. EM1]|nr:unnamed protein product [Phytomonas sp. EM1]|eukprot:CCW59930.1 unnamed protein product [Phytomonas sp. isolate EM1]